MFRLPPPYLWTPLSPQRVKGFSPLTIPKMRSKRKNASRFAKRIFWASPVYGSADGVTLSQDFTFSKGVKSAAKQQIGETRKKRLAQRLAFLGFDNSFGIIKGEQPLIRASRASKVAGAFLVLFWHAKENLAQRKSALPPRHRRENQFKVPSRTHPAPAGSESIHISPGTFP